MHGRSLVALAALTALLALPTAPARAFGPDTTTLLSRPTGLAPLPPAPMTGGGLFESGRMSANGQYIAFVSGADGLSPVDDDRRLGIWLRNRKDSTSTTLIAHDPFGTPDVSDDGTRVCFTTTEQLDAADTDTAPDAYVRDVPTGTTKLVSGATPVVGFSRATSCAISGDGTDVAFETDQSLAAADTNALDDIYRFTYATSAVVLVSRTPAGVVGDAASEIPAINADGEAISFATGATNLFAADTNDRTDIIVHRVTANTTTLVSAVNGSPSTEGNNHSTFSSISADGDYVAFDSFATNLGGDTVTDRDVFRRRVSTNATELVSRATGAAGVRGSAQDRWPEISPDGDHVAWTSDSVNLDPADTSTEDSVYIRRDLDGTRETILASRAGTAGPSADAPSNVTTLGDGGEQALIVTDARNLTSSGAEDFQQILVRNVATGAFDPVVRPTGVVGGAFPGPQNYASLADAARTISIDGRFVAFTSGADGLSDVDDDRFLNAFVRDTLTHQTILVSRADGPGGAAANADVESAVISGDGRRVAFVSEATNLLTPAQSNSVNQVFVRDLDAGTTKLASRANGALGALGNVASADPALDHDGSRVAFSTTSTNLGEGGSGSVRDVFVRDLPGAQTLLASRADGAAGASGDGGAADPYLDASGDRVAFESTATNLGDGDTDNGTDIHVRDLGAGRTLWASRPDGTGNAQTPGFAVDASISADGNRVAFSTIATNMGNGDDDIGNDVHVRDFAAGTTTLASRATGPSGVKSDGFSLTPGIAADGRSVAFVSTATNLSSGDVNGAYDAFLRRLDTHETTLVSRGDGANGPLIEGPVVGMSTLAGSPSVNGDGSCVAFHTNGTQSILPAGASPDFSHVLLRVVRRECPLPPIDTTITGASADGTTVTLTFTASAAGATFLCRVDGGAFTPCTSGVQFTGLSVGDHTFEVKAVDPAGFEDATPATRTATVKAPGGGGGGGGGGGTTPAPVPPATPPVTLPVPPRRPVTPAPPPLARLDAAKVLALPKACTSRRRFRIKLILPAGARVSSVTATINRKRTKTTRKGANVDLRGLPKGRIAIAITVKLADGRTVTTTRRYRTCAPARKKRG